MLIVNDHIPPQRHDPEKIADQLALMQRQLGFDALLLDFQRPDLPENTAVAKAITATLSCPVGITPFYADNLPCSVFLPPPPLHQPLAEYLTPWQGREIWLEGALDALQITVTEAGSQFTPLSPTPVIEKGFDENTLHCRYSVKTEKDKGWQSWDWQSV